MTYSEKLKSPKWQKKRLEVLSRDNFTCCKCKDTETELHVHHLKYTGEPYDAPLEDLETLCKHCHYYYTFLHKDLLSNYEMFDYDLISIQKHKNCFIIDSKDLVFLFMIWDSDMELKVAFNKGSEVLGILYNLYSEKEGGKYV